MNLKTISNIELTNRLQKLVSSERKLTHVILLHIIEIESRRLYAELGFDGMFSYLTKGLGYSESAAYRRLQSARLLKSVPKISEKLEAGTLNLSQLTQLQKCLKAEMKNHPVEGILEKIENKSSFETKRILAVEFNQPLKTETIINPQKDDSVRIELTFTKKQFEQLERAKNLLSHTIHNSSFADVIENLAVKYNKSVMGRIANGIVDGIANGLENVRSDSGNNLTQHFAAATVKRPKLSIKAKRNLMNRAEHACQYVDKSSGKKCDSKFQLQVDHIHPVSKGGNNDISNLQILCRIHNHLKSDRLRN